MMTLEDLIKRNYPVEKVFNEDGTMTKGTALAYEEMISLLADVGDFFNVSVENWISELDRVADQNIDHSEKSQINPSNIETTSMIDTHTALAYWNNLSKEDKVFFLEFWEEQTGKRINVKDPVDAFNYFYEYLENTLTSNVMWDLNYDLNLKDEKVSFDSLVTEATAKQEAERTAVDSKRISKEKVR